uniref:ATP synthase subunit delta, chloroplastic n=1 Tax=Cyanidium caldarium TaxID=2771 RepID=ATPD_CYACA|nr:ATP synthase CF1 delta subunit [Cyanidium caldarium]Q9TM27.1 RecName: Full=ATP synthase subunit delta, chloroplastic; AltName: Full=ATP synthase F(1) sector subunit delta; AltName: Full=F-type ATPase subunit delta [Cyanidium caldarium]AAF13006.1 unknown [Cyanidium caldarium]WDB00167.1 ATP synthase CF1 delta subunit [Cyanidium caldarium]
MILLLTNSKIIYPYSEALFSIAKDQEKFEVIKNDMELFVTFTKNLNGFKKFLETPLINKNKKIKVVKDVFSKILNSTTLNFISILINKNRIMFVSNISEKYNQLVLKDKSVKLVKIACARQLSEKQAQALSEVLKHKFKCLSVKLIFNIEPELIAGFKIFIESQVIDVSLQGELKEFEWYLTK